jgi:hypothetical protein
MIRTKIVAYLMRGNECVDSETSIALTQPRT